MDAIRRTAVAQEGRLVLEDASFHEGEAFEVVVLPKSGDQTGTVGDLLSGSFGIWADRQDIGDGVAYAHGLRRQIEENLRGR